MTGKKTQENGILKRGIFLDSRNARKLTSGWARLHLSSFRRLRHARAQGKAPAATHSSTFACEGPADTFMRPKTNHQISCRADMLDIWMVTDVHRLITLSGEDVERGWRAVTRLDARDTPASG